MLIVAGAVFHYGKNPNSTVADITTAFRLLEPALGNKIAPKLFAIALLCSGQQATITGKQVNCDECLSVFTTEYVAHVNIDV